MPAPAAVSANPKRPLEGLRIVDLSMGWAGPLATRHLADLGGDIIKVEACQYPDWWRGVDNRPIVIEQVLYEKSAYFNVLNRNKRGVTLDLTTPDGVRLVKDLVRGADAVIENYSIGVLPKLGLDYDSLRKVNPGLVMVSMPAFAADGPWGDCRAYGSTLEQASGLPSISGRPEGPPAMNHIAFGDPDRRTERRGRHAGRAGAPPPHRARSAHRPVAGRMHVHAGRALDRRAIGQWRRRSAHGGPASRACAARLLSLPGRRRMGAGGRGRMIGNGSRCAG